MAPQFSTTSAKPFFYRAARFSLAFSLISASAIAPAVLAGQLQTKQQQFQTAQGAATVSVTTELNDQAELVKRSFVLSSGTRSKTWEQAATASQLHSGNVLFDALFSLAEDERQQNSVQEITDWGFHDQQAIACPCFETGAKWHYVWTRDLSYSLDLGLSALDPARSINSLRFKTSSVRPELLVRGVPQTSVALQDTGSGGSWPVSTDRVVWILAASGIPDSAEPGWTQQWYDIGKNTLQQDLQYAFDTRMGLFRGETSFLDWREQSYPSWTKEDTRYLAESFSLSTNVLHYMALMKLAQAAGQFEPEAQASYQRRAAELKDAINRHFWLADQGLYSSYIGEGRNPVAVQHYDLLGLALAIEADIASPSQASAILKRYPLSRAGAPVLFPMKPGIPIYHNRAIWPFVSAYALRAARRMDQADLVTRLAYSLIEGAAFHGSNMENMDWLTQATHVDEGPTSGPVINSERQLWSVAGYLDMVVRQLLGIQAGAHGIELDPYIPVKLANDLRFANTLELQHLRLFGKELNVQLQLPAGANRQQVYRLASASINGEVLPLSQSYRARIDLASQATDRLDLVLTLQAVDSLQTTATTPLPFTDAKSLTPLQRRQVVAPKEPTLQISQDAKGQIQLSFDAQGEQDTRFHLYKNGRELKLKRAASSYFDKQSPASQRQCYSLSQSYQDSKLMSLPSRTLCTQGALQRFIAGDALHAEGINASQYLGLPVYKHWGEPEQSLSLTYQPSDSGWQSLNLQYFIDNGPINTGITAVVKQVLASCPSANGVQRQAVVLPHRATAMELAESTEVRFEAKAGETCQIHIIDGFNMSYLQHFTLYTGGKGGRQGPLNKAVIHAVQIVPTATINLEK